MTSEKRKAASKAYHALHKKEIAKKRREKYQQDSDRLKAATRAYYAAHSEEIKDKARAYGKAKREAQRQNQPVKPRKPRAQVTEAQAPVKPVASRIDALKAALERVKAREDRLYAHIQD